MPALPSAPNIVIPRKAGIQPMGRRFGAPNLTIGAAVRTPV